MDGEKKRQADLFHMQNLYYNIHTDANIKPITMQGRSFPFNGMITSHSTTTILFNLSSLKYEGAVREEML